LKGGTSETSDDEVPSPTTYTINYAADRPDPFDADEPAGDTS